MNNQLKLGSSKESSNFIDGIPLLCEEGTWKIIQDPDWTVEDATVVCRQLGYSPRGLFVFNLYYLVT